MSDVSVADCLDALEHGHYLTLHDLSTLCKRSDGQYVWTPFLTHTSLFAKESSLTSVDLSSLLTVVMLRDATIDPATASVIPTTPVAGNVVEADSDFVPYAEKTASRAL